MVTGTHEMLLGDEPLAAVRETPRAAGGSLRARQLRAMIEGSELGFLMEAHNGISAKIVEEAGFPGIWASGLTISASLGVRDSNEASWTQVLDVLEFMTDATEIPVLVDGDTGYGNFNNVRRLVRKLSGAQVAGVCIEDKLFPKTNSFIGDNQPLAEVDEFCGRIKAGKDSQENDDFVLVARVEALIAGRKMEEALRRAEAYVAAGADGILIHSRRSDASEILEFCRLWAHRAPLVIVPTTYHATPMAQFRRAGVSTVIWANQIMRSAISAMQETARRIQADCALVSVEDKIAPVKEIFRLVGNAELEAAERRYLPAGGRSRAIILAASGGNLGELTLDRPKVMVDVRGRPLLHRTVEMLTEAEINDVTVVSGYRAETVAADGVRIVTNAEFASTGEVCSLTHALETTEDGLVVLYGDVLFRAYVLKSLLSAPADIVVAVDAQISGRIVRNRQLRDFVRADRAAAAADSDDTPVMLVEIDGQSQLGEPHGEWMGLVRFSPRGVAWLNAEIARLADEGLAATADMPLLLTRLARRHGVQVRYFPSHWVDVDSLLDVAAARNFA